MRMRNHLEHILTQVLSPDSLDIFIEHHKPQLIASTTQVKIHTLLEMVLNFQVELDSEFLDFLTDDEVFELGFQFGFEGKYNRWQIIEDICAWFENNRDYFEENSTLQLPDSSCTHEEIIDWLAELTFNELQKICHILNVNFNGIKFFNNLCENSNIDQIISKLSFVNKELLHKVILFYYKESSFSEAEQQELELDSPEEEEELDLAYEILEVQKNASNTEIKKSFFKKAKDYHPDSYVNSELDGLAQESILDGFRNVKKAFEIIKSSRPGPW